MLMLCLYLVVDLWQIQGSRNWATGLKFTVFS